jgi:hypothetical protein
LSETTPVGLREAGITPVIPVIKKQQQRDAGDIMMKVNNYSFINCTCGLKIKIPPDYRKDVLFCPRCGRQHSLR